MAKRSARAERSSAAASTVAETVLVCCDACRMPSTFSDTAAVPRAASLTLWAISLAADSGRYDAYVALGVVIRGETYHFEVVSNESARGIMALTLDGLAIGNGILTVENEEQALARADKTRKDKGGEAAKAALAMLALKEQFGIG